MSQKLISLNADLQRLQDEGYEVEVRHGYLILSSIPYVTSGGEVARGKLVSNLELAGEKLQKPSNHQAWFAGEFPCDRNGKPLEGIRHSSETQLLCPGIEVHHHFSNKPSAGYDNYFHKMSRYADIISHQAQSLDPTATPKTFRPIPSTDAETPFHYVDTASSRAGITSLALKCAQNKIAIVGVGGTGSYVLDLLAKTHVVEIHLFDGDVFCSHNAFRAPGAPSLETLNAAPSKVSYFSQLYSAMRRGVVAHQIYITEDTVAELSDFDFVFLCVDKPGVRKLVFEYLTAQGISFIDAGMDVQFIPETASLFGMCRVTASTAEKRDHFSKHVSLGSPDANDVYATNIQIADLNSLSASMAVIRWKKLCGFYQDQMNEHQSVYTTNTHHLSRDEMTNNG